MLFFSIQIASSKTTMKFNNKSINLQNITN